MFALNRQLSGKAASVVCLSFAGSQKRPDSLFPCKIYELFKCISMWTFDNCINYSISAVESASTRVCRLDGNPIKKQKGEWFEGICV